MKRMIINCDLGGRYYQLSIISKQEINLKDVIRIFLGVNKYKPDSKRLLVKL